jgi:hypothetical protein
MYIYVAQSRTNKLTRKHHVYKVGYSNTPHMRVDSLAGSGSTETYELVLMLPLPDGMRDSQVLAHALLQPFVLYKNADKQKRYISIFGGDHAVGIKKRREIVMFGHRFTRLRVKSLFRRVIRDITDTHSTYMCKNEHCISNNGETYCLVCKKFIRSICNRMSRHYENMYTKKTNMKETENELHVLENIANKFDLMINSVRRWNGPKVGEYWLFRASTSMMQNGHRFHIGLIKKNEDNNRSSRIQWWGSSQNGTLARSVFTPERTNHPLEEISWDYDCWLSSVCMKRGIKKGSKMIRKLDLKRVDTYVNELNQSCLAVM